MSTWCELVVEGEEATLRAFVAGFVAGRGATRAGVFGLDCGLEHASLGARLKALVARGSHHLYLAPGALAVPLAKAVERRGAAVGLRLERRRNVRALAFDVRVEAFSRPVAAAIRRNLLRKRLAGVVIEALDESEEENPEARGTDLYSPVHAYVYRASGRFVGRPPGILDLRRRATELDFVTIGGLHVDGESS